MLQRSTALASSRTEHLGVAEAPEADGRLYAERSLVADEGNGVDARHGVGLEECKAACDGNSACHSFSYSSFSKACYLKDREVTMESASKKERAWDWHFKTYFPVELDGAAPPPLVPLPMLANDSDSVLGHAYVERSLVASKGREIYGTFPVTLATCEELCDRAAACHSFTYSRTQQACYLKVAEVSMEDAPREPAYLDFKTYIKLPMCSSHTCTQDTILLPNAERIPGSDDRTCCQAACSSHACAKDMLLLPSAGGIPGSDDSTCCEAACSSHGCAQDMILLPNAERIPGSDDNACCEAACSSHTCAEDMLLLPGAGEIPGNDDSTCCEAA